MLWRKLLKTGDRKTHLCAQTDPPLTLGAHVRSRVTVDTLCIYLRPKEGCFLTNTDLNQTKFWNVNVIVRSRWGSPLDNSHDIGTSVLSISEMTGWIQVHEMLSEVRLLFVSCSHNLTWKDQLCQFLSHLRSFPFRLWISLLPLRTVWQGFPETQHYFPLAFCHMPFPWTKICGLYLVRRKPTCPSRDIDFRRIIAGSNLISSEEVQADSNTSCIVVWMISGENRVAEENRPKSHLLMSSKQRPTHF